MEGVYSRDKYIGRKREFGKYKGISQRI